VLSRTPEILQLAKTIRRDLDHNRERISSLIDRVQTNIDQAPVDVFPAPDVFKGRKAECRGNAYLYAAFTRALSIPSRVANAIAYSESRNGFLYHSCTENLVTDRWIAVDPIFGQPEADATHLKLIEGETLAKLGPLTRFMGCVKARVREVGY